VKHPQSLVFWICLQCLIVSGFLPNASWAGELKADPRPTIAVLVYNHAQALPATITGAEREAGRIMGEAGVQAVWLDCLDRHSAANPQGLCKRAREPADVVLRILPAQSQNRFPDTLFGITFLPTLASDYYEYAVRLATSDKEVPTILGCAIAHELGHLLLGRNSHSGGGIMHGEWGPKEFRLALMGGLLFTSQQSKPIRAEAQRRMRLQTESLKEQRIVPADRSLSAGEPIIIGGSSQQERFLTCVVQILADDVRNTPNSNERMTVIVLEHWKFLETREAFHAHKTKLAFSSLQARRIYLSSRMFGDFETLLRCITHELGHFETQSIYEHPAEIAAGRIRQRARQICGSAVQ
jgi:hypothetical protein